MQYSNRKMGLLNCNLPQILSYKLNAKSVICKDDSDKMAESEIEAVILNRYLYTYRCTFTFDNPYY